MLIYLFISYSNTVFYAVEFDIILINQFDLLLSIFIIIYFHFLFSTFSFSVFLFHFFSVNRTDQRSEGSLNFLFLTF